jgi:hypothetical protein
MRFIIEQTPPAYYRTLFDSFVELNNFFTYESCLSTTYFYFLKPEQSTKPTKPTETTTTETTTTPEPTTTTETTTTSESTTTT